MNATATRDTFVDVPLVGFMSLAPPAHDFAIYPILPRRSVTLLAGHGGSGKSFLALALVAHAASGVPFAGFITDNNEPMRAAYVSMEDAADRVLHRLQTIATVYGLDPLPIEQNLQVLDGSNLAMPLAIEAMNAGTRSIIGTFLLDDLIALCAGVDIVVIDNASEAFSGDENARREVRAFVRLLTDLAQTTGAAVVLVAHVDKATARGLSRGQSYSGSTAWSNSVRSRLALIEDGDIVVLHHEKANFSRPADPVPFRRSDEGVLVMVSAKATQDRITADADAAMMLMRAARQAGIAVYTTTTGPNTAWRSLQHLPEAEAFNTGHRLLRALEQLGRDGRLVRAQHRTENRKVREVWALPESAVALAHFAGSGGVIGAPAGRCANPPHTPPIGALARPMGDGDHAPKAKNNGSARIGALAQSDDAAAYRAAKDGDL